MSKLVVQGGKPLSGEISIGGSKNAILPLMASTLLTDKRVCFSNVPQISDVDAMKELLKSYGVEVNDSIPGSLYLRARNPRFEPLDSEIGGTFRASILVLGPLLARLGRARVYLPGGDDIDSQGRGVDFHITNLEAMGAIVHEYPTYIDATVRRNVGLQGARIVSPKVSVGATQNTIMAACGAHGTTTIENASIEPETLDLVEFLRRIGASITVDQANRKITIEGKSLQSYSASAMGSSVINHTVIPDRIEAGTYAIAAAITGGKIALKMNVSSDKVILNLLESEFWRLLAAGMQITRIDPGVIVVERLRDQYGQPQNIKPVSVKTSPYPGFPTDMHPQWAALMCFSDSSTPCWIEETVFDSRFKYVEQLQTMGASIGRDGRKVYIIGGGLEQPYPGIVSSVVAPDIRGGAALILAALAKNGTTVISGIDHVDRGYEKFVEKFQSCGAHMTRQ